MENNIAARATKFSTETHKIGGTVIYKRYRAVDVKEEFKALKVAGLKNILNSIPFMILNKILEDSTNGPVENIGRVEITPVKEV